jgi:cold shock CspA family protein
MVASVPFSSISRQRNAPAAKSSLDLAIEDNEIFFVSIANGHQMSRYKEHRGPRQRGYDEDYGPDYQVTARQPEYFSARTNLTQGSEPVKATVKWFNADKGFGFVAVAGGSDAFMPARALEAAGHSSVPDVARVNQGQKGPQVTEVIDVDTSTATMRRRPSGSFLLAFLQWTVLQTICSRSRCDREEAGSDYMRPVCEKTERPVQPSLM